MQHRIVILCFFLLLSACKESILHDLDELKANKAKLILARQNIPAYKVREAGYWSIQVAKKDVDRALQLVDRSRMLNRSVQRNAVEGSSFVQSREERQRVAERKLAWSLEETLESYPGVLEARVHLYLRKSRQPMQLPNAGRASVLLVGEGSIALEKVKQLVSGASGVEHVSVVLAKGRELKDLPISTTQASYWKELPKEVLAPMLALSVGLPAFLLGRKRRHGGVI